MPHDLNNDITEFPGARESDVVSMLKSDATSPGSGISEQTSKRRSGLGRGLSDLIPSDGPHVVPTHLQPDSGQQTTVARIVIAETNEAVFVELDDSTGERTSVPVDGRSIEDAVIEACLALLDVDRQLSVRIEDLETVDGLLVVATVNNGSERSASAVFVELGRPYAVARAVFQAVQDF